MYHCCQISCTIVAENAALIPAENSALLLADYIANLTAITAEDTKTISMLKGCHKVSAEFIGKILEDGIKKNGEIKGFKRGVVPLLGYFISHEGHHRGNILLTLKNCGFKIPDELKYGIWEWNKI